MLSLWASSNRVGKKHTAVYCIFKENKMIFFQATLSFLSAACYEFEWIVKTVWSTVHKTNSSWLAQGYLVGYHILSYRLDLFWVTRCLDRFGKSFVLCIFYFVFSLFCFYRTDCPWMNTVHIIDFYSYKSLEACLNISKRTIRRGNDVYAKKTFRTEVEAKQIASQIQENSNETIALSNIDT